VVAPDIYDEKIVLSGQTSLINSADAKFVTITSFGEEEPTINITGTSTIFGIDVQGGSSAIQIDSNAHLTLVASSVSGGADHGIYSLPSERPGEAVFADQEVDRTPNALIVSSSIVANPEKGAYFNEGIIRIVNSRIEQNFDEGMDIQAGVEGEIINTRIRGNRENGIEVRLEDDSDILVQGSLIEGNFDNGINVQSSETPGDLTIIDTAIVDNQGQGLRCNDRGGKPDSAERPYFPSVIFQENITYSNNLEGDIDNDCED
jgi:hypothetical protein